MKKGIYILYGGIVFCLITATGCKKPVALEYLAFENFKLEALSAGESVISADVKFYNPNPYKLQLKRAEMDVSINNTYVGHSKLDTFMQIPRQDTFFVPVNMKVDVKSLLSNSLGALLTNEVDVKMDGNARIGKAGIFFNFPISYQGKQKWKLF
ncbi:MAG: LEA type 2 family protein [Chitinophagaceae bacterium]